MKRLSLLVGLLLAMAHANAEEISFYVGQTTEEWAFKVTGKGRALVGNSLISVRMDNIKITNNPIHSKSMQLKDVEVAYGYTQPDGKWNIKHVGARKPINRKTYAGDTVELESLDATLSLADGSLPKNYWVIIVIWINDRQTVYAHSRKDIFYRSDQATASIGRTTDQLVWHG